MTTLEAPAAAITDADLARPLRVFQNRPALGVPFWRWECRACGDSGGGGSHPDAVGRALTHCVEHPSHPSSLVPPVNCRQDNPRAPLRTIYEWLVARSALEPLDVDPLVTGPAPDDSAGLAPSDQEFAALTAADGEFTGFGPLDGDYAVFASGFGPMDGEFADFPVTGEGLAGLEFLDGEFDGEFAGPGGAVQRRLADGWSRALPVTWPPNDLFETTGTWDEPPDAAEPGDQADPEQLGAWPPLPAGSLRPTGESALPETGDDAWGAVIGGAAGHAVAETEIAGEIEIAAESAAEPESAAGGRVVREPVIGPTLPSRRLLPQIAGLPPVDSRGPATDGPLTSIGDSGGSHGVPGHELLPGGEAAGSPDLTDPGMPPVEDVVGSDGLVDHGLVDHGLVDHGLLAGEDMAGFPGLADLGLRPGGDAVGSHRLTGHRMQMAEEAAGLPDEEGSLPVEAVVLAGGEGFSGELPDSDSPILEATTVDRMLTPQSESPTSGAPEIGEPEPQRDADRPVVQDELPGLTTYAH